MADEVEREEGEVEAKGPVDGAPAGVGRFLYRLALAGVGGVVLAQEELTGLFSRKEPSAEGEPLPENEEDVPTQMEATVDRVLHTLKLPSKTDVEELSRKIEELAARVETLRSGSA